MWHRNATSISTWKMLLSFENIGAQKELLEVNMLQELVLILAELKVFLLKVRSLLAKL